MEFKNKQKLFKIDRFPFRENDPFQGWNSADELILNHLNDNGHPEKILVIEDEFGTLAVSLEAKEISLVNDSFISVQGIKRNLNQNIVEDKEIRLLSPFDDFPEDIDLIILKIPKANNYLEFLLKKLNNTYKKPIPIIAGGMIKYLNSSVYKLFEQLNSDMKSSLGWKKARLIFSETKPTSELLDFTKKYSEYEINIVNYPNLFSFDQIDIGTRFFIENFQTEKETVDTILDLGCGNGILGVFAGKKYPIAQLMYNDINFSAIESARETAQANDQFNRSVFIQGHAIEKQLGQCIDLVLCNPPFHDHHKISLSTAQEMFSSAKKVLKANGELFVVANRHLGYHQILKSIYDNYEVIKENEKFVLLKSINQ